MRCVLLLALLSGCASLRGGGDCYDSGGLVAVYGRPLQVEPARDGTGDELWTMEDGSRYRVNRIGAACLVTELP